MWQKIQIALILILSLALAASLMVSWSMSRQQGALAEALQAQADVFRAQAQSSARRAEDAATNAAAKSSLDGGVPAAGLSAGRQAEGLVYITGLVARPGPYSLPSTSLTLWRAVITAGGVNVEGKLRVTLTRGDANPGESPTTYTIEGANAPTEDPILRPGDVVSVMRE